MLHCHWIWINRSKEHSYNLWSCSFANFNRNFLFRAWWEYFLIEALTNNLEAVRRRFIVSLAILNIYSVAIVLHISVMFLFRSANSPFRNNASWRSIVFLRLLILGDFADIYHTFTSSIIILSYYLVNCYFFNSQLVEDSRLWNVLSGFVNN